MTIHNKTTEEIIFLIPFLRVCKVVLFNKRFKLILRFGYHLKGTVQGVGFRPFVYNLAKQNNLIGFIKNTQEGVELEIEGEQKNIKQFKKLLLAKLPPLSKIDYIKEHKLKPLYMGQFEILQSEFETSTSKIVSILPDIAICKKCLKDIFSSKRYISYFAANCTCCGPRYTIAQTVPYDRANTSMKKFILCKNCLKEYKNPQNRRFHAQGICCKECGPVLKLKIDNGKWEIKNNIYKDIAKLLSDGRIGAIKGIGGFHLVCDATNNKVIKRLRKLKNRPTKPFAIMCRNLAEIKSFAKVSKKEQELLLSKEAPIVLLENKNKISNQYFDFYTSIAPNIDRVGVMLPYSGFYHILFKYINFAIVATSANISGEPIITTREDIEKKLNFVDFVVDYNREIVNFVDDSVVQVVDDSLQIVRLSRGYAPKEIKLPFKLNKKILSFGANQKSSIAIAFDDKIILSPYIGDIKTIDSINHYKKMIDTFKRFYSFKPDILVCDKHNGYESSKIAKDIFQNEREKGNKNIKLITIQHHLSHLYSVKAEYGLDFDFETLSFVFDGTGVGEDNTLWGGEVFVGDERKYHFEPIKLLGMEKAIKEPKRVALSMLFQKYSIDEVLKLDLPTTKAFKSNEIKLLHTMWQKNLNLVFSSSVGRLFDGIASIGGLSQMQSYEGEAGLLTETIAKNKTTNDSFKYKIINKEIKIEWDFFDKDLIMKFYNTLVKIIIDISLKEKLPIILSGGVWQNRTLLNMLICEFKNKNIKYYYNQNIPINDQGIAVGQIYCCLKDNL